jgi:hypothetical protein
MKEMSRWKSRIVIAVLMTPPIVIEMAASAAGSTVTVNGGGNLQAAINNAQPGDTLLLQAGATFTGNFVLPAKSGTAYITIRSSAPDSSLPDGSTRIGPSFVSSLPKLQSPSTLPALATAPGAHHYRLQCLEFLANVGGGGDVLDLGDGSGAQNTLASVPHDLVVDRIYLHGDPTLGQKRGIGLNSASTSILNSYIADIKANGQDSQAIAGWNGPGPFTITNNYLEAAGENFLLGGADPAIAGLVPSDITFTQNHLTKQLVWQSQPYWNVKNLLEIKNAQRLTIDHNLLEYNWLAAQSGYAVVFTPRNQDGGCPWCVVQQLQFTNNIVRHVASGIQLLGTDDTNPSQLTNHIVIRNNLFDDLNWNYGGEGRFLLIEGGDSIVIDHNTIIQTGNSVVYAAGGPASHFVFTNNICPDNQWAILGAGSSPGLPSIQQFFPGSTIQGNVIAGANPAIYPASNYYPASLNAVGFVDMTGHNYALSANSPFIRAATDGTAVGCDVSKLVQGPPVSSQPTTPTGVRILPGS